MSRVVIERIMGESNEFKIEEYNKKITEEHGVISIVYHKMEDEIPDLLKDIAERNNCKTIDELERIVDIYFANETESARLYLEN